jgi:hypothetical protein
MRVRWRNVKVLCVRAYVCVYMYIYMYMCIYTSVQGGRTSNETLGCLRRCRHCNQTEQRWGNCVQVSGQEFNTYSDMNYCDVCPALNAKAGSVRLACDIAADGR